ncbi:hypothetical protein KIPB_008649 [Kipferlia bialata]|uniref:Uncharacterized protein n=1 Tax=Kipferlia bialata TaxID=797122 RepID=A0A9K3GLH4_9EUKA|nr:hypothetical protein KIPB_008649 [Kipferlia bialata]|eukprot:g8649.t1
MSFRFSHPIPAVKIAIKGAFGVLIGTPETAAVVNAVSLLVAPSPSVCPTLYPVTSCLNSVAYALLVALESTDPYPLLATSVSLLGALSCARYGLPSLTPMVALAFRTVAKATMVHDGERDVGILGLVAVFVLYCGHVAWVYVSGGVSLGLALLVLCMCAVLGGMGWMLYTVEENRRTIKCYCRDLSLAHDVNDGMAVVGHVDDEGDNDEEGEESDVVGPMEQWDTDPVGEVIGLEGEGEGEGEGEEGEYIMSYDMPEYSDGDGDDAQQ